MQYNSQKLGAKMSISEYYPKPRLFSLPFGYSNLSLHPLITQGQISLAKSTRQSLCPIFNISIIQIPGNFDIFQLSSFMRVNPKPWICHRFKIRQNDFFNIQRHDIVKIVIIYISAGYGRDDVSSDVRILTLRGKYFSYNFIPPQLE